MDNFLGSDLQLSTMSSVNSKGERHFHLEELVFLETMIESNEKEIMKIKSI